jgi:hypothetical protein
VGQHLELAVFIHGFGGVCRRGTLQPAEDVA